MGFIRAVKPRVNPKNVLPASPKKIFPFGKLKAIKGRDAAIIRRTKDVICGQRKN